MGNEAKRFEHGGNLIVVQPMVKLHEFLKTMEFLNFADDNREWRLPSREEIVELAERYPGKVVNVAYRNDDNGRAMDCMRRWYFTNELSPMEFSRPRNVTVYDLDNKVFRDFYFTDGGVLNCLGYGQHNAVIIGERRSSLLGLEQKAEGRGE